MNSPVEIVKEKIDKLLSQSSEKELNKRKLGRNKKGVALDELRAGLSGIVDYLNDISGEVKDHALDKDTISRLADKSWGSEQLKKQQASLKRTGTEIGKAIEVVDTLIRVVSEQHLENQYSHEDLENGIVSEDEYYSQRNPAWALRARRDELGKSAKTVRELRDAIEWAKDIKKRDEEKEHARQQTIKSKLKNEITKQVCDLGPLDLVAKMAALKDMWFKPREALENLAEYGYQSHQRYLINTRSRFIDELLDAIDYRFTFKPGQSGFREPLVLSSDNVALEINRECSDSERIKNGLEHAEYAELYKSAEAIQSAIQAK